MTADTLKSYSCKDLAEMAKKRGVQGWHGMRKEQLVKALLRVNLAKSRAPVAGGAKSSTAQLRSASASRAGARKDRVVARPALVTAKAPVKPAAVKPVVAKAIIAKPLTLGNGAAKPSNGAAKLPAAKLPALNNNGAANGSSKTTTLAKLQQTNGLVKHPAIQGNGIAKNGIAKNGISKKMPVLPVPVAKPTAVAKVKEPVVKESAIARRLQRVRAKVEQSKDLSGGLSKVKARFTRDRLVVMVRDPFWLHAYWELTRQGVERAQAALGQEWHAAKPILRMLHVTTGGSNPTAESHARDIEIHGGVNNWYIDVQDPPKCYRLDIGYRAPSGRFYVLARSNVVSTPKPGSKDALDENWTEVAENYDKIYALSGGYSLDGNSSELQELFEERLRRPMSSPTLTNFEGLLPRKREFFFELDAELIVYGVTEPDAHVTLQGDPVRLRPDGTFTVRFSLPNCRQVIPAVACSAGGGEQRTTVLAVERNTKVMEPLIRDASE
jgi:hypothetical protein